MIALFFCCSCQKSYSHSSPWYFSYVPISNLPTKPLLIKYSQNQRLLTNLVHVAIIFHLDFDNSLPTGLPVSACCLQSCQGDPFKTESVQVFPCTELSSSLQFHKSYKTLRDLHSPLTSLVSSPTALPLAYSAPALPASLLFLQSQAGSCSRISALAISSLRSYLSQIFTWLTPSSPLGLSECFLSVRSSLITLFKIIMPPQPVVLPILFSCFVCNTYCQLTSCTYYSFIYWLSSPLGCSFLEGRDFCVSFIALSPGT